MDQYQCHKIVGATKITKIVGQDCVETECGKFKGLRDRIKLSKPQVGWYLVKYDAGYRSFSPPEPFEAGYTKLDEIPDVVWEKKTELNFAEAAALVLAGEEVARKDGSVVDTYRNAISRGVTAEELHATNWFVVLS